MISFDVTNIQPIRIDVTSVADDHPKFIHKGFEVSVAIRTKRFQLNATCQVFKPELNTEQIQEEVRKAFIEDMLEIQNYNP